MDEKKIAYCGIACTKCPVYIATKNDDDEERAKVAGGWAKQFGFDVGPEDINCDGCSTDGGRLFNHCRTCGIRLCAREKQLVTCADCADYSCEQLDLFHQVVPIAKKSLEKIRTSKGIS